MRATPFVVVLAGGCSAGDVDEALDENGQPVIFGATNSRVTYKAATNAQKELASAVGVLVVNDEIVDQGGPCPDPATGESFDCTWQLKAFTDDQVVSRFGTPHCNDGLVTQGLEIRTTPCSAFLIGPDTFVTAGHCIVPDGYAFTAPQAEIECLQRTVVMRWRESDDSSFPNGNPNVLERHVYRCVEVLAHGGNRGAGPGPDDWAVFRVDRPVSGGPNTGGPLTNDREPLQFRTTPVVAGETGFLTIGHSYGRPLRIDREVSIALVPGTPDRGFDGRGTFEIRADAAPGSSGSPVIDASGKVAGIVVGGPEMFERPDPRYPGKTCIAECFGDRTSNLCPLVPDGQSPFVLAVAINQLPTRFQPEAASCAGGTLGTVGFCSAACRCSVGEGSCVDDSECREGQTCDGNGGAAYGLTSLTEVCTYPQCASRTMGLPGSCDEGCLCGHGAGGCDEEWDCMLGLKCIRGQSAAFGVDLSVGVCLPPQCEGRTRGTETYCSAECPCGNGSGDCDSDAECLDKRCISDRGAMFGMSPTTDVCQKPICGKKIPGSDTYCTGGCDCGHGGGDCDSNSECEPGLVCGLDHGAMFKMKAVTDVCMPAACATRTPGSSTYCTTACRCGHGGGACDSSAECMPGLVCAVDHGRAFGMAATADVCMPSACASKAVGATGYCSTACPCGRGGGDCNVDTDCLPDLRCVQDNGAAFGFPATTDVCVP